jgi:hypothetical protein
MSLRRVFGVYYEICPVIAAVEQFSNGHPEGAFLLERTWRPKSEGMQQIAVVQVKGGADEHAPADGGTYGGEVANAGQDKGTDGHRDPQRRR